MNQLGYYGKICHRGDFVRFNLPQTFITVWDDWLGAAMLAGHDQGPSWQARHQANPHHRFALSADIAGSTAWLGLMCSSADKVGRPYPFCLACSLPVGTPVCHALLNNASWFERAEALLARVLREDHPFDQVQAELADLNRQGPVTMPGGDSLADAPAEAGPTRATEASDDERLALCVRTADQSDPALTMSLLLDQVLRYSAGEYSLWLRADGTRLLVGNGLPSGALLDALLTGTADTAGLHVIDLDPLVEAIDDSDAALPADALSSPVPKPSPAVTPAMTPLVDETEGDGAKVGTSSAAEPSDEWAALDAFDEGADADALILPEAEPLELEEDDQRDAPWEQ